MKGKGEKNPKIELQKRLETAREQLRLYQVALDNTDEDERDEDARNVKEATEAFQTLLEEYRSMYEEEPPLKGLTSSPRTPLGSLFVPPSSVDFKKRSGPSPQPTSSPATSNIFKLHFR